MPAWLKVIRYQSTSFAYSLIVNRKKQHGSATGDGRRTKNPRGFTLIELMVTISIIAILAAVGLIIYSTAQKSGRISKRVQDLKAIQTSLEVYKAATGDYPIQSAAATCLNSIAANALGALVPTYMPALPTDPLNNAANCYKYQSNTTGTEYKVWTATNEMSANEYNTQATLVDPFRDGGASGNCTLEAIPAGTTAVTTYAYAWALYASNGTTTGTNSCGF